MSKSHLVKEQFILFYLLNIYKLASRLGYGSTHHTPFQIPTASMEESGSTTIHIYALSGFSCRMEIKIKKIP